MIMNIIIHTSRHFHVSDTTLNQLTEGVWIIEKGLYVKQHVYVSKLLLPRT